MAVAVGDTTPGEAAVHAVVAQQVGVGLHRPQVVDRHHLDVAPGVLDDRAQDQPADAAEAVDGDADGHGGKSSRRRRRAQDPSGNM